MPGSAMSAAKPSRYTSRKWLGFLLVITQTGLLCWFERIDGLTYSTVAVAALASYFAANVYQKEKEAKP